jgi:hypothetical protein
VIQAPQSSPTLRRLPACALALVLLAVTSLSAQARSTLTGATELRRGIGGIVLATLPDGAPVSTGKTQSGWVEVTLSGWIIGSSVGATSRDGFDVMVTASEGENLREAPNGEILARFRKGTLLRKLGAKNGWVRVKRTGWVPRRLVAAPIETSPLTARQAPAPAKPAPPKTAPAKPAQAPRGGAQRQAPPPPPQVVSTAGGEEIRVETAKASTLAATPEGGQLATLEPGTGGRVVGRAGDWVRVQLEGWVRETDLKPAPDGALIGVSAAEIRADPQRYVGKTVEWRVQFIAIQTADELRSELPPGQPFLLTRGPLPEPGFVYIIVPRGQLSQFEALAPLQELTLRVVIRAPRTKYLATPVVALVSVVNGVSR